MQVQLPDYITIGDYRKIVALEHLSDIEKMVEQIAVLTKIDR